MTRMIGLALAALILGGCAVYATPPGVGVGVYAPPPPGVYVAPGPYYWHHPYYHRWHSRWRGGWQGR
ncbi:MAG TPA: hypothetical protein VFO18_05740 [Methylomirabilota bacterium]|nr:hypothetical protein [Methylomirabilota bacterium]